MVKFSFFTVRSKCCKKSKFVVLFLFFFVCWIWNFQILYILRLRFFLCLFLRCSLWLLLLPSINVSFLLLLNVLYSRLCMCAFSHSLFFLFRVSTKQPWPRTVSKNACANNPRQPTNRKKRFPGEGVTSLILIYLLYLSSWSERTRARKKRECAETLRTCEPTIDRRTDPWDSERIEERTPDEILTRYTFAWFLSHFGAKHAFLSSLLPYRTRGGRDEHFDSLIPKKHKTRQIATTTTTKERDTRVWERNDWSTMWEEEEDLEIRKHDSWLVFWWFFLDLERL